MPMACTTYFPGAGCTLDARAGLRLCANVVYYLIAWHFLAVYALCAMEVSVKHDLSFARD